MALLGAQGRDFPHLVDEAHVEHAVGLVQHQHRHPAEVQIAFADVVHEPAGRSHQHMHPLGELARLRAHFQAADHDAEPQLEMAGERREARMNLHGQFPRRHQHQGLHRLGRARKLGCR